MFFFVIFTCCCCAVSQPKTHTLPTKKRMFALAHYSRTHTCKHSRVIHKHTSIISVEFFRSSSIIPNDFPYFIRVLSFTVYYFLYTLNFHMFRFFLCKSIFTNFFQQKCICHLVFFSATHPFLFEMCFLFLSLATLFSYLFFHYF